MKVLLDTDVILDAIAAREPWNREAEEIFLLAANKEADCFITASATTDIYYLIRKHLHNSAEAKQVMKKLYVLFGVLDVSATDCIDALQSEIKDYEDAVVDCIAERHRMDYIVTRNIKDYEKGKTKSISPKAFLELNRQE